MPGGYGGQPSHQLLRPLQRRVLAPADALDVAREDGCDLHQAATIGGAAAGAYAGHELEKRQKQTAAAYKFTIRMDNGSYQTLMQSTSANFRVGDRVKIENGVLQRY